MKINSKHFEWVDALKGVAILIVILGHINNPFNSFLFSFHMPLFFIISGFFIKKENLDSKYIYKNFKRLMAPFFIYALIGVTVEILKRFILHRDALNNIDIINLFFWMDIEHLSGTYAFVLWFLPTLFVSKIIIQLIFKIVDSIIVRFLIFLSLFFFSFYVKLPFSITNAFNCVFFVYSGSILFYYLNNDKFKYNFIFLLMIVAILFLVFNGLPGLDMAAIYYSQPFVNVLWAIIITLILSIFIKKLSKTGINLKLLTFFGSNTMLFFIFHPYTNNLSTIIVDKYFDNYISWVFKMMLSLLMLIIIYFFNGKFKKSFLFKYV